MLDVTQGDLARAVGVSRPHISAIEIGRANPTLDLVDRICEVLGIELELLSRRPVVIGAPRQRDLLHARCSGYVDRRLRRAGWETRREVEVVHARSHGWIDLVAYEPRTRTLLIIEVKTRLDDVGAIERQLSWYEREATEVAARHGWRPLRVVSWLVILATDEVTAQSRQIARPLLWPFQSGPTR